MEIMILVALFASSGLAAEEKVETLSDKYCGYLIQLSNTATEDATKPGGDTQKKLDELMAMANILNEINPIQSFAISKKMTFEQFVHYANSKGLTVTTMYKGMYIQMYARAVCGEMQTETTTVMKNGSTHTTQKTFAKKQFDPAGQAYFDEMKSPGTQ